MIYEKWADVGEYVYLHKEILSGSVRDHMLPHYHNAIECAIVAKGSYMAHVNVEDRVLREGDIVFIDSFLPHFFKINGEAEVYAVVIHLPIIKNIRSNGTFPQYIRNQALFEKLLRLCEQSETQWKETAQQFKTGFAYSFLGILLQHVELKKVQESKSRSAFLDIMSYVGEHYREEITLSQLANKFGYASSYFSRTFNEFAGISLREYINRLRIAEALKLKMLNGNLPWSQIASKVGYVSLNTFYRAYARYAPDLIEENHVQLDLTGVSIHQDDMNEK